MLFIFDSMAHNRDGAVERAGADHRRRVRLVGLGTTHPSTPAGSNCIPTPLQSGISTLIRDLDPMEHRIRNRSLAAVLVALVGLTGCNLFEGIRSPQPDAALGRDDTGVDRTDMGPDDGNEGDQEMGGDPCGGCGEGGECIFDDGPVCRCVDGYVMLDDLCTDVDECADGSHNCHARATCTNTPGGFECACDAGWEGDGVDCRETDEGGCEDVQCPQNSTCTPADNPEGYECVCDDGYEASAEQCVDADECADGTAGCDVNATCTNSVGGFDCTCDAGFVGDGFDCVANPDAGTTCRSASMAMLGEVMGDTSDSSDSRSADDCPTLSGLGEDSPDEFYLFTAPADGMYRIDLTPSGFDAILYVLTDCMGACTHDSDGDPESITLSLTAGESVIIVVDGWIDNDESGPYTLDITQL